MHTTSNFTATRNADYTRTAATRIIAREPKPVSVKIGENVRRFVSALMRSLATPHI